MNLLELLDKRRHVWHFDTEHIPSEDVVRECLYNAWKVTPSKNNFMPYHVNVIGPEDREYKEEVHRLSRMNKKRTNERANVNNIPNYKEDGSNPNFTFYDTVPYLLIISQRVCEPNPYIAGAIVENNDIYEQMHEHLFEDVHGTACIEAGMFMGKATAFLLQKGIDTTYIKCYPSELSAWKNLPFVEGPVVLIAGLGYCKRARRENMNDLQKKNDYKPEPEQIVRFV